MGTPKIKHLCALATALALTLTAAACGSTVSTSGYKGESHAVAQTISNFQSDATTGEDKKICQDDLTRALQARLKTQSNDCQGTLKSQLQQVDNFNLTVEAITVNGSTAIAHIKSTYSGKDHLDTLQLVKEGKSWRISSLS
jgi:hypothetical protein